MATRATAIEDAKTGDITEAVYEHPFVVRLCHWLNAISLFVMVGSGLQIFRAFPSFGAKIPQKDLLNWPKAFALGGWLGGALQWHLTFMARNNIAANVPFDRIASSDAALRH